MSATVSPLANRPVAELFERFCLWYDNALAESIIGLFKTEVIRCRGPWKTVDEVEYAVCEWVDWFNYRRLLESIGDIPPAELEQAYYEQREGHAEVA